MSLFGPYRIAFLVFGLFGACCGEDVMTPKTMSTSSMTSPSTSSLDVPIENSIEEHSRLRHVEEMKDQFSVESITGARNNWLAYKGNYYSTLADVPVDGSYNPQCQNYYITLPYGWVIASYDSNSSAVISSHLWGTGCLALANGNSYYAYYYRSLGYCGSGSLTQSGNQYKVTDCNKQILIMRKSIFSSSCLCKWSHIYFFYTR